jgi:dihydrofolate reductase
MIKLIVSMGINNEIGIGENLLGHFPQDLKHFKNTTKGHIVAFGSTTMKGFLDEKPLAGRYNIAITNNPNKYYFLGDEHNLYEEQSTFFKTECSIPKIIKDYKDSMVGEIYNKHLFFIGGSSIYNQVLELDAIDEMIITRINKAFPEATHFFPTVDFNQWELIEITSLNLDMSIETYKRLKSKDDNFANREVENVKVAE